MLVDAHQHVCWHGHDADAVVRDMDANGIARSWLLTWEIAAAEHRESWHTMMNPEHRRQDGTHAGSPLSDVLRAAERHPGRFVLGFAPHTESDDASARFEAAYRIHGVRVCGEWKARMPLDDPRCLQLFRKAGELGCPVTIHLDSPYRKDPATGLPVYQRDWFGGDVDNLARALRNCPATNFIGHAPGFWREISGDADDTPALYPDGPVTPGGRLYELFETYPNLHADLSANSGLCALKRDPDHAQRFLRQFADRLLFGRDDFNNNLQTFLASLALPAPLMESIASGNACRLAPSTAG